MYTYIVICGVCIYGKRPKRSMEKPALNRSRR